MDAGDLDARDGGVRLVLVNRRLQLLKVAVHALEVGLGAQVRQRRVVAAGPRVRRRGDGGARAARAIARGGAEVAGRALEAHEAAADGVVGAWVELLVLEVAEELVERVKGGAFLELVLGLLGGGDGVERGRHVVGLLVAAGAVVGGGGGGAAVGVAGVHLLVGGEVLAVGVVACGGGGHVLEVGDVCFARVRA